MSNHEFIVYADINCPFCFALHERLIEMGYIDIVDWRTIEHAPNIQFDVTDVQVQATLTDEVKKARELAGEINIIVPAGRPKSGPAIRWIKAANKIDPVRARLYRTKIYRALWVDGLDVSDTKLLDRFRQELGLPELDIAQDVIDEVTQWQQEWEQGDFSRFIPAMVTGNENRLLGLPPREIISAFLSGNKDDLDIDEGSFCYLKPKEKILIVSDKEGVMDCFADALEKDYQIEFAQYGEAAILSTESNNPPDLILMDVETTDPSGYETCLQIKDRELSQNIPVILFSENKNVETEVKAFDNSASDFISLPCIREIIIARVRVLLRLKRTTDLLEQYARLDGLTEVPNRREFDRVLEKEWRRSLRTGKPLSLILIDVDHFKAYNDNYGHMQGDQCLKLVAQKVEESIFRPHDTVARYGGEEFVVILPETDGDGALNTANKIQTEIQKFNLRHEYSSVAEHITVSQGIATIVPQRDLSPDLLIDAADTALYQAKDKGRNRVETNR